MTMRLRSSGSTGGFKTEAEIARAAAAMPVPLRRKLSLPTYLKRPKKSNMKVLTLDESLHSTWESSNQDPKTVGWNEIHIREYARTVGDNPSCSSGPPLTIGWEYSPGQRVMTVDGYESSRSPRKSLFEMVLPRDERQAMLQDEWKISHSQIASAVRTNIQIKNQRRQTVNNLGKMTRLEELMESAKRKVSRLIKHQKSTSRQIEEMNIQSQRAETERRKIWAQMDTLSSNSSAEMAPKESPNRISQRSNGGVSQQPMCRREDQGLPSQQPRTTRSNGSEESSSRQEEELANQNNKQDEHQQFEGHDNDTDNDGFPLSQTVTRKKRHKKRDSNGHRQRAPPPKPQQLSPPQQQHVPPSQPQRTLPPQQQHQYQQPRPQYQQQPQYPPQRPPQQQQQYHPQQQQQQYNQRPTPIPLQQQQQRHHYQQPQHFQQPQSYQQPPQSNQQPMQYQPPPPFQKNQQQQLQQQEQYTANIDDVDDYVFDEETKEFVPRTK